LAFTTKEKIMTNDYEYQLLKKAQEHLVLARKIENRDCDIFDHPQFNAIEELAEEWINEMFAFIVNEHDKRRINEPK
jgi:hypothetical protein